jgi:hypothetical protein
MSREIQEKLFSEIVREEAFGIPLLNTTAIHVDAVVQARLEG